MNDPTMLIALAGTSAAGLALASGAVLKGWSQWLELRRDALLTIGAQRRGFASELRTLRERVRRLEAIADGAQV